ncbi:hypothetical protein Tco_1246726 [Tanacetum coccineum]
MSFTSKRTAIEALLNPCYRTTKQRHVFPVRKPTDGQNEQLSMTTDVRQAVVWFVLNNSPEVDADILAYREKSPDNVETNFPAWFNHKIREKKVNDGCSEELFSLACGPISTCTYPACIVNGVKFVVHERDILHTTQCQLMACLHPRSHVGDPLVVHPLTAPNRTYWPMRKILGAKISKGSKADHFTRYGSAEEARNHLPPNKVWGDRTEDEWNNLVDWWSHPDRVARSLQNAANRAKNTILDMKTMQDQVRAGVIPFKTDQEILDEVVPSTNRQNMSGKGRKLPGGGSTSRRRGPQAFPDPVSQEELDRILRQKDQEAELLRKQTAEAQQRAYLAALKADAAYQNIETMYGAVVMNSNLASTSNSQLPRFITNPHNNDTRSVDELARDRELAGEDNDVGDNNEEVGQSTIGW